MGYKEYLESRGRTEKEVAKQRHRFFAQHPELVGAGRNPLATIEENAEPIVVSEIHYIPVELELTSANTARQMRQLRGELAFMRNKLNELSERKQKPYPSKNILINK